MTPREWAIAALKKIAEWEWAACSANSAIGILNDGAPLAIVIGMAHEWQRCTHGNHCAEPTLAILNAALKCECEAGIL